MTGSTAHTLRLLLVLTAGALLACSGSSGPISDEQISLRPEGLLQVTAPAQPTFPAVEPGGNRRFERAYYGAPPMIPHSVADAQLTAGTNDCLDCHEVTDKETPGIPATHRIQAVFADLSRDASRNGSLTAFSGFGQAKVVAGTRYNCVLCHATQSDNTQPIVGNAFQPTFPAGKPADALDGLKSLGDY